LNIHKTVILPLVNEFLNLVFHSKGRTEIGVERLMRRVFGLNRYQATEEWKNLHGEHEVLINCTIKYDGTGITWHTLGRKLHIILVGKQVEKTI
jgi:hypothetical protein